MHERRIMDLKKVRIYIEENDRIRRPDVEQSVSDVLAIYPDFVLARVSDDQLAAIMAQDIKVEIQGPPMIRLRTVEFDPTKGSPKPPESLRVSPDTIKKGAGYWIVQLIGPVKAEWGDDIRALGGVLQDYVPDNAFLVRMTKHIKEKVEKLTFVTWVGFYEPIYKVSLLLMGRKGKAGPEEFRNLSFTGLPPDHSEISDMRVLVHDASDLDKVSREVRRLGGSIIAAVKDTLRISLHISCLGEIAGMGEVKWIEPNEAPEVHSNVAA